MVPLGSFGPAGAPLAALGLLLTVATLAALVVLARATGRRARSAAVPAVVLAACLVWVALPGGTGAADGSADASTSEAHVLVLDAHGLPVQGARLYVESVDLTDRVDNIAAYVSTMEETLVLSGADGRATFATDVPVTVAVRVPGQIPARALVAPGEEVEVRMVATDVRVAGHRGGAEYAPENTLSAIRKSALLGVPAVEIDVQMTLDEVLVLVHDGVVDHPASPQRVWLATYDELRERDIGSSVHPSFAHERIPTLEEALGLMAELGLDPIVEVKITDDPRHALVQQRVGDAIRAAGLAERSVVISFDPTFSAQCGLDKLRCGYIEAQPNGVRADPAGLGKDLLSPFVEEHHLPFTLATPEYVASSQAAGNRVTAWTVNDPGIVAALVGAGIDGITTDAPWEILQALRGVA